MTSKKVLIILIIFAAAAAATAGYLTKDRWTPYFTGGAKTTSATAMKKVYVCPMHSQIVREKPGDCPICGMSLVERVVPATGAEQPKPELKPIYTCPMHSQVTREKPGDCPICGMALVKKETAPEQKPAGAGMENMPGMPGMPGMSEAEHLALKKVSLDPRAQMLANVATVEAVKKDLSQDIRANGKVAFDEQSVRKVNARYGGRIEKLSVNYTGQRVGRGQQLLSIYSPELVATQKEYMIAKRTSARLKASDFAEISRGTEGMLDAARARMKQWGLTDGQIDRLDKTGEVNSSIPVYSPVSGTVTELKVRQGDYVTEGGELYTVSDLSRVWVFAEVYESDLSKAGIGSRVEVTTDAYPGERFLGKVSFIDPVVNPRSRTIRLRAALPNPYGKLKPEMFVTARVFGKALKALAVPASAVLYTGDKNIVWVETVPGTYEMRAVQVGSRTGSDYQIISGITEGERVVTQGAFLIDSEAQLRESAGGGTGMADMPGMKSK
jgi:membrane fusion protein, copper/silver efflux system